MAASNAVVTLELAGSKRAPMIFLLAIAVLALLAMIVGIVVPFLAPASRRIDLPLAPLLIAPALMAAVIAWIWRGTARIGATVAGGMLIINTGIGSRRVPLAHLRTAGLRVIDLEERPEFRPRWKKWGSSMPGFQAGWFRLRNGESAVCLLLDRRRVSYLRSDDGVTLLLSLARPDQLRSLLAG